MTLSPDQVAQKFKSLSCAAICDASPLASVMRPQFISLKVGQKISGLARPVVCQNDYLTVIKAMEEAKPNDILVVDGRGQTQAVFGELLAAEAKRKKMAGAVIDGAVRDVAEMQKIGFPVFYRSVNPQAGRAEIVEPQCEVVSVGGVTVTLGDWILGDEDGLLVVPQDHIEAVLDVALEIKKLEQKIFQALNDGQTLKNVLGLEQFRREHERDIRSKLGECLENEDI